MRKRYICEVSIIFGKETFINTKKVLFIQSHTIQSLINENKVIKFLTAFHTKQAEDVVAQMVQNSVAFTIFVQS